MQLLHKYDYASEITFITVSKVIRKLGMLFVIQWAANS